MSGAYMSSKWSCVPEEELSRAPMSEVTSWSIVGTPGAAAELLDIDVPADHIGMLRETIGRWEGLSAGSQGDVIVREVQRDLGELSTGSGFVVRLENAPDGESLNVRTNNCPDGTPRWFNYVERRLNYLENYTSSGPDEEGSYPEPPSETIKETWRIVHNLFDGTTPTPTVVPAEEGGVQLTWHKHGWDLVISVLPEETSVWARNRLVGENWSLPLSEHFEKVRSILQNLG